MKLTKKLQKEFWEGCGLMPKKHGRFTYWYDSHDILREIFVPPITLDNLFKYAVLKVGHCELHKWGDEGETFLAKAYLNHKMKRVEDKDPALALFWAIYGVIK